MIQVFSSVYFLTIDRALRLFDHTTPSACKISLSPSVKTSAFKTAWCAYKTISLQLTHQGS